ncbi:MAG: ISAs1 family transposase [Oscillospiraceae bacterium]|nr:ISAs1 family transposase [Oscillospiraceae bacterium]
MLREHFEGISDPRQPWKVKHSLIEIIIMVICAVVAECEAWYQVEHYCRTKQTWFRKKLKLKLKNGIPSHDTFERIFSMINPKELEACFFSWVNAVNKQLGEIVSIDGKTLRGSKGIGNKAIHMVSAWANKSRLVLGQVKTDEKSNEVTAIPDLISLLELRGCIVTIDAMGCQKEIAKDIVKAEADYVFGLKGNQSSLHDDVKLYFETETVKAKTVTREKGHGRIETREYLLETEIDWLYQKPKWAGLKAIGAVKSGVWKNDILHEETRYFITSLTDVKKFAEAVRGHWGIENSLHWVLDVAFNEDNCRMRKDNCAENFAVIRHIALNLLKKDDAKMSIKSRRHRCAYDDDYLYNILFASNFKL